MTLSSHFRVSRYALVAITGVTLLCKADTFTSNATEYFIKHSNSTDYYVPLNFSDINLWEPAYRGLPMKAPKDGSNHHFEVDIAALSTQDFKHYFLTSDSFANFTFTDEAIEEQRAMLLNQTLPSAEPPNDKRSWFGPAGPCVRNPPIGYYFVSHTTGQNQDVWGAYHYMSDKICGPAGGSYTTSISHVSGISVSGSFSPASFGKDGKILNVLTTFISAFGISINGPAPNTVSLTHTYSVSCPDQHACFLYERPHLSVYQGWTQANAYDRNWNIVCPQFNKRFDWNIHVVWPPNSAQTSAAWGQCYSSNGEGCEWTPLASDVSLYCPDSNR